MSFTGSRGLVPLQDEGLREKDRVLLPFFPQAPTTFLCTPKKGALDKCLVGNVSIIYIWIP